MTHKSFSELSLNAKKIWDSLGPKAEELTLKERLKIPPQDMPCQDPRIRKTNVEEVTAGYTLEQAMIEAARCLQCPNKPCVTGCPVAIDIPRFIKAIQDADFQAAIDIIKKSSLLPAVCGRVCPQENQCQEHCTVGLALKDIQQAVSIGRLERFVADWEQVNKGGGSPSVKTSTGKKIAVIGSGPAGITAAAELCRAGHSVTLFEAFHKPGGVLVYGIPEFRLPKQIVKNEINTLKSIGVAVVTDFIVGRTRSLSDLRQKHGFAAMFIGAGAGLPKFMNIPGENLVGVFSANEYLTRANLMKAYDRNKADTPAFLSKNVAVLGGGNVALDAARMALRLGAAEVQVIYRRTQPEMPARQEEIAHAREEGVVFQFLENVKQIYGDNQGRVKSMQCLRYELGEPDSSGRPRPVEIKGSEFIREVDTVIVAIGNEPHPLLRQTTPGLATDSRGRVITDENSRTSIPGVYAGGDIVLGSATVILAMGQGRRAAQAINALLQS
ncbi:MAG: NADPH-dependent glutamate synthase [Candidatus Omnitrophica bacterium]|nr:NADPH-dependent glutamate synthase [Candidatus Omnitrophota bacterium]